MKMSVVIAGTLILLILASGGSFWFGMRVETWKSGASTATTLQTALDTAVKNQAAATLQFNQLSAKIDALNAATQSGALATQDKIGEQGHALQLIATQIHHANVGNCSVTPAFDQLLQQTYETVYPGPAGSSGGTASPVAHAASATAAPAAHR
jgi:hypothetical protein